MARFTGDGYKDLDSLTRDLVASSHPNLCVNVALVCQIILQRVQGLPSRETQEVELFNGLLGIVDAAIEDGLIEEE